MERNRKIEEALALADDTRALEIGPGAVVRTGDIFREQFPGRRALVVSDSNTFAIAGSRVQETLEAAGIPCEAPTVFDSRGLYAEYAHVERLMNAFRISDAVPVAVGSGTINDLAKLSSFLTGRKYICVATVASMDGYTSFGASITRGGVKQTFDCAAPQAVVADTELIGAAPVAMNASGYADLYANITAGADWILADALGIEAIDPAVWDVVHGGLKEALADARGVRDARPEAIRRLVEGLLLGGFAMQAFRSSRPASGAEHLFSHLWDMEEHRFEGRTPSHGFKVSIGVLAVTALYEQMLSTDMSGLDVEAALSFWPRARQVEQEARDMFRGTGFSHKGITESAAKYVSPDRLRRMLERLRDDWPRIRLRLRRQIIPFEETRRRLETAGAPTEPEQIGISRERLRDSFYRAQHIRRRYTVLDLAVQTGYLGVWMENIFGPNGIWEIS